MPPFVPSDLTAHLGFWLRLVSNAVSQSFARRVEAKGVTVAEWVFLRTLFDFEALPPSRLAAAMGMTRGAITKLADRLVAKGLVLRAADPDDGRAQSLALSPEGRNLVPVLAALADDNDAAFFADLSQDDRAALVTSLRQIATAQGLTAPPTG